MIFLDANYFLRYLTQPDSPGNLTRQEIASALFEAIEFGDEEATTSEAVLAEVAFILASKRQYNLPAGEIADFLAPIIRLPSLKLPHGRKQFSLRATEIWTEYPKLGFVDALTAAMVEDSNWRLATFDSDFTAIPNIRRWTPATKS